MLSWDGILESWLVVLEFNLENIGFVAINVQQLLMDDTIHWQMQQLQLELHQPCAPIPNVKG